VRDCRWEDVLWSVDSAVRHLRAACELFEAGRLTGRDRNAYRDVMALMHAMQSGYTSLENALLRAMDVLGEDRPSGPDWHKLVVDRSTRAIPGLRPAILSSEEATLAREVRKFRHWAMHAYDQDFEPRRAADAMDGARQLAEQLRPAFQAFIAAIDPE